MSNINRYEINHADKQIIVTKSFLKEAGIIGSPAYNVLVKLRKDLPDFAIEPRQIAKKQGKKSYGKLTYKVMGEFITAQEEENAPAVLAEFQRVQQLSKVQAGSYAFVKTWFLTRYKEVFTVEETEEGIA